jgi:hypothetical protein
MVNSKSLALLLTVILLTASTVIQRVYSADISECNMKKTEDDRLECMASYSGSAAFCDKIRSWERRQHCVRGVIRKQRQHR